MRLRVCELWYMPCCEHPTNRTAFTQQCFSHIRSCAHRRWPHGAADITCWLLHGPTALGSSLDSLWCGHCSAHPSPQGLQLEVRAAGGVGQPPAVTPTSLFSQLNNTASRSRPPTEMLCAVCPVSTACIWGARCFIPLHEYIVFFLIHLSNLDQWPCLCGICLNVIHGNCHRWFHVFF